MAGQARGPGLTGEKHPRPAVVVGGQATRTGAACNLCAVLERNGPVNGRHSPSGTDHGLRLALVDDDEETRLEARRMVRTERDDWALEVYHPSCPNALEGDRGSGSPAGIVLVGVPNREGSHLACVRRIKALAPDLPVLIISGDCDEASIAECCVAGADGYVLKPFAPGELARAISSVARGWPVLCREAQKAMLNVFHQAATATTVWFRGLSGREQEIAGCLVGNLRDKVICERLGMARGTVHVHLTSLYRKLRVHSRQQAVARLLRGGGESSPF
jgi:DNA-binding NarL/FixJ family response regulator